MIFKNKIHFWSLALFLGASFLIFGCDKNSPAEPEKMLKIEFTLNFTGPTTAAGTFTATGAFAETGTAEETFEMVGPQNAPTGVKGEKTLKGKNGNITLSFDAQLTSQSQTSAVAEGTFTITGGTGGYASLSGTGKTSVTVDFAAGTLVGSYEGDVKGY
ncbi:MAG: hypothetical protein D6814_01050 [Calditrichaeota bacterium]|nr:MAG: hypothetical protein D6814_01050 [Calditrichota bacterium]